MHSVVKLHDEATHSVVKLHDEATQMFPMVYYVRIVVVVCWLLDVPETS